MAKGKFERIDVSGNEPIFSLEADVIHTSVVAQLTDIVVHHTVFAIITPLFCLTVSHLFRTWARTRSQYVAANTIGVLFFLNLLNLLGGNINNSSIILGFLDFAEFSTTELGQAGGWLFLVTMQMCVWIADSYMIWRLCQLWRNWKVAILPSLLFLSEFGVGIFQLVLQRKAGGTDDEVPLAGWEIFMWISFVTSAITSMLIIYRLLRTRKTQLKKSGKAWLWTSLTIESATMYTLLKATAFAGLNTYAGIPAGIIVCLSLASPCLVVLLGVNVLETERVDGIIHLRTPTNSDTSSDRATHLETVVVEYASAV